MSIAKVTLDGVTQMDLTGVTVESNNLLTGVTAHNSRGEAITGAARQNLQDEYLTGTLIGTYTNDDITVIRNQAFRGDSNNLTILNFPNVISIGIQAFRGKKITTINAPKALEIKDNAFFDCTELQVINMPSVTTLYISAFRGCQKLKSIHLQNVTTLGSSYCFYQCINLETLVLPSLTSYPSGTGFHCQGCSKLEVADLGPINNLRTGMFNSCTALNTLIFRNNNVMAAVAPLTYTPFDQNGTGGTIYIPKVLYDHLGDGTSLDYKNATTWSNYDAYGTITWAQIQGSYYETHYGDGTQIPT